MKVRWTRRNAACGNSNEKREQDKARQTDIKQHSYGHGVRAPPTLRPAE